MTRYDPTRHHRRSIRLKGYDYTQPGAYFITICVHNRVHLFGEVVDGGMRLNDAGRIADQCWRDITAHFPHVELDAFVIMPNHVHGVLWIMDDVGAKHFSPLPQPTTPRGTSQTIGSVVRGFKIGVTKWFRQNTPVYTVWQRNYYEHIIREERALNAIRRYILDNPNRWHLDRYNPDCIGDDPLTQEIWAMINNSVGVKNFTPPPLSPPRDPESRENAP